jgi:hypothetical protein
VAARGEDPRKQFSTAASVKGAYDRKCNETWLFTGHRFAQSWDRRGPISAWWLCLAANIIVTTLAWFLVGWFLE